MLDFQNAEIFRAALENLYLVPLLERAGNALRQAVAKGSNFAILLWEPETP
ncbi:MAG TPA: hypothetical protein VEN79_06555 [Terriglobia bacterium]|nr:hypothetical protein [Terriglobia bacterium]